MFLFCLFYLSIVLWFVLLGARENRGEVDVMQTRPSVSMLTLDERSIATKAIGEGHQISAMMYAVQAIAQQQLRVSSMPLTSELLSNETLSRNTCHVKKVVKRHRHCSEQCQSIGLALRRRLRSNAGGFYEDHNSRTHRLGLV